MQLGYESGHNCYCIAFEFIKNHRFSSGLESAQVLYGYLNLLRVIDFFIYKSQPLVPGISKPLKNWWNL
jgi:hypothetical protein